MKKCVIILGLILLCGMANAHFRGGYEMRHGNYFHSYAPPPPPPPPPPHRVHRIRHNHHVIRYDHMSPVRRSIYYSTYPNRYRTSFYMSF